MGFYRDRLLSKVTGAGAGELTSATGDWCARGGWVSYMRTATTSPDAAVSAATL